MTAKKQIFLFVAKSPIFAPLYFYFFKFKKTPFIGIPFIFIRQKEFLNFFEKQGRYELLNVKNWLFFSNFDSFNFLAFLANYRQFLDSWKRYLKTILTCFLFFTFLSILSKAKNNHLGGKKFISSLLFGPPKMAKMAKKWGAQNKFASLRSNCSCYSLECPFWTWNTAKSLWEPYLSNGTFLGSVRQLQG